MVVKKAKAVAKAASKAGPPPNLFDVLIRNEPPASSSSSVPVAKAESKAGEPKSSQSREYEFRAKRATKHGWVYRHP